MLSDSLNLVRKYPMGPKVRNWLGIADGDYLGTDNEAPGPDELHAFQFELMHKMASEELANGDLLTDLIEELVGMNLPLLAIKLADAYPNILRADDFRANLHLGNACMLTGDFARAEDCFRTAQKLVPQEPAPYVNLVQIYCDDGHLETALKWCKAGLEVDKNFLRLWELYAWIQQQLDFANASGEIKSLAARLQSWAGASLLADLASTGSAEPDPRSKMQALEPFYQEGLRDLDFLVEYTAALGMAGQYEHIPAILWQVEGSGKKDIPWQLYFHTVQAFYGLSREDQGLELIKKIEKIPGIPPKVLAELKTLAEDVGVGDVH